MLTQWQNDQLADQAIAFGAGGATIDGRLLRVGRSEAPRAVRLARRDGGIIPRDELLPEMLAFGDLEICEYHTPSRVALVKWFTYGGFLKAAGWMRDGPSPYMIV